LVERLGYTTGVDADAVRAAGEWVRGELAELS